MISALQACLNPQQLLIEPFERLRFITLFVLATLLATIGAKFVSLNVISPFSLEPVSLVDAAILGTVFGVILGASQWLVIRKFIPNWYWIIATAMGFCYLQVILQASHNLFIDLSKSGQLQLQFITVFLLGLVVTLFATLWLGLLQWLILRYYVKPARWWLLIFPAISLIMLAINMLTSFAQSTFSWNLTFDWNVIFSATLGVAQSTGLCLLKRKVQKTDQSAPGEFNKLLITTPQIRSFKKLWDLSNRLYRQIHKSWEQETSLPARLIYLLGLTEAGKIIVCQPADQVAADYISQTPLPNLISSLNDDVEQLYRKPLARFMVTFTPLGGLEVRFRKSYKLVWIALSMFVFFLLISTYPTWLQRVIFIIRGY